MTKIISNHRIGAVSALSGVPVSTLRVWETRHGAFSPTKSEGRHRLYSDEEVLRATLIKRLTERGHSISTIATLDVGQLSALTQQQTDARQHLQPSPGTSAPASMAVVGAGLAARMTSSKFGLHLPPTTFAVTEIFNDLQAACASPMSSRPQILLVRLNSLHVLAGADIQRLAQTHHFQQVIVLYNFGQEPVIASLRVAGFKVRREPISDAELGELIGSVLWMGHNQKVSDVQRTGLVPARKYSDETLARIANISSNVLCECPRHVAELITQLASFEQYSQECLNKSAEDAHLHAYLCSVSGSARALFEKALEMVAEHEQIALTEGSPAMGPHT